MQRVCTTGPDLEQDRRRLWGPGARAEPRVAPSEFPLRAAQSAPPGNQGAMTSPSASLPSTKPPRREAA